MDVQRRQNTSIYQMRDNIFIPKQRDERINLISNKYLIILVRLGHQSCLLYQTIIARIYKKYRSYVVVYLPTTHIMANTTSLQSYRKVFFSSVFFFFTYYILLLPTDNTYTTTVQRQLEFFILPIKIPLLLKYDNYYYYINNK